MAETFRKDYRPPAFDVPSVELSIGLAFDFCRVVSRLHVERRADGPLRLNSRFHRVTSVAIDGAPLGSEGFSIEPEEFLTIHPTAIAGRESFVVEIVVEFDPSKNEALEGLYKSGPIICTQCEADGFRRITPFIDRPDVLSKYKVRLEADKASLPVLLSNGNVIETGDLPDGRHFVVYEDPFPKPCALFAVVGGPLKSIRSTHVRPPIAGESSGRPVDLIIWADEKDVGKLEWAMDVLKKAMKWDEEAFGRVYDLDVFNLVATEFFNFGAMENKSLNIFNISKLLAHESCTTDSEFMEVLEVVGHEYFHNWTGNRVSCRDWFQLTLKEGLTVYRAEEFCRRVGSAGEQRIKDVKTLRSLQFPQDASPLRHPIRPESFIVMDNFYTATVYRKGSAVIRMYEVLLGVDGFRKGMDLYFERHDGTGVTCDDFRAAMADANRVDLSQFERWYSQCGTPEVVVECAAWDRENKKFRIVVRQHTPVCPTNLPLHIPLSIALVGRSTSRVIVECVKELKVEREEFVLCNVEEDCVLSINRNFSAPIKVAFDQSLEDLAFILAHEVDEFSRWEAGQQMMRRDLLAMAKSIEEGAGAQVCMSGCVLAAFKGVLLEAATDRSCQALSLALPTLVELVNVAPRPCDPCPIGEARRRMRRELLDHFRADFERIYQSMVVELKGKSYNVADAGSRHLRDICLWYLCAAEEGAGVAFEQYKSSVNMTDRLGALNCLCGMETPLKHEALEMFKREATDPIRMDKWFRVQAAADVHDVISTVESLMSHPDFNIKNPNRADSLARTFAFNLAHFHSPCGRGYELISGLVTEIDKFNPAVAARIAATLCDHQWLKPNLQEKARAALQRVVASDKCSRATAELCNKSLCPK